MARNKMRLYLGYWKRQPTERNTGLYHVGLFLVPKKPGMDQECSTKLHAVNRLDPETVSEIWKFVVAENKPRTNRITAVVFLGKVPPEFTVEGIQKILEKVYVPAPGDAEEATWRCCNWVWDAMELLAKEGVIPELPGSGKDIWNTGLTFVLEKTGATKGCPVYGEWLFTCDTSGKEITSEIRPLS